MTCLRRRASDSPFVGAIKKGSTSWTFPAAITSKLVQQVIEKATQKHRHQASSFVRAVEYGELYNNLGTALLRMNNVPDAEAALREAARLRPEIAAIHVNLAGAVSRRGETGEARFLLERAIRLNPNEPQSHHGLAAVADAA